MRQPSRSWDWAVGSMCTVATANPCYPTSDARLDPVAINWTQTCICYVTTGWRLMITQEFTRMQKWPGIVKKINQDVSYSVKIEWPSMSCMHSVRSTAVHTHWVHVRWIWCAFPHACKSNDLACGLWCSERGVRPDTREVLDMLRCLPKPQQGHACWSWKTSCLWLAAKVALGKPEEAANNRMELQYCGIFDWIIQIYALCPKILQFGVENARLEKETAWSHIKTYQCRIPLLQFLSCLHSGEDLNNLKP